MTLRLKFWGVRGSIACPSAAHIGYGGNTSCLEVDAAENRILLDAGTGIRGAGRELLNQGVTDATLLLTHTHWDHINGFPFFGPAFVPSNSFRIMAGHLNARGGIRTVLADQMANPMFPVPLEAMQAELNFVDFQAGDTFNMAGGVTVRTCMLNHPNGAVAYRIERGGVSLCYVSDTEHVPGQTDENIVNLIAGSDLVIYDSTYTEDEFPQRIGWGHSTWNEGVRLCRLAQVKNMAIFHHDPDHDDTFMAALEEEAHRTWDKTFCARDNMVVEIRDSGIHIVR